MTNPTATNATPTPSASSHAAPLPLSGPLSADADLVRAARAGNPSAFTLLLQRHHGLVFAIAYARLGHAETAEDAAQEVFLRAWLHLARLEDPARFAAWLARIARNLATDWASGRALRLAAHLPLDAIPEPPDPASAGARAAMEREEETAWLRQAIQALPEEQREIVLLHYMEGLSKKEIAQRLEVHPSTVGRQLEAALKSLKRSLEPLMRAVAPRLKSRRAAARAATVLAAAAMLSPASKTALAAAAPLPPLSLAAPVQAQTTTAASSFLGNLLLAPLHAILAALNAITPAAAAGGQLMGFGKLFVALAALASLAAGGFYYFHLPAKSPEGLYIFAGFRLRSAASEGPYLLIKRDARGNPRIERPINAPWRLERAPEGKIVMLRQAIEFMQVSEYRRLLQPDPQTGKPLWFKEHVLAPSATVPGDWDVVETANWPPSDPPIKLKRPLPSLLHRIDDPRVIELIEKTAAVRDQEWRPASGNDDSYARAFIYTQHPPLAPHDDLLGLAATVAQAHPTDAHIAMLRIDALIAARDFKNLETEIEKWRPVLEKPSFLRGPFHKAQAALRAWKLSAAGKNADELMTRIYNPQSDLATRLRLVPEALKYNELALVFQTVWTEQDLNFLEAQTTAKVMGILANFMLFQGRRDEAIKLLAANYQLGQLIGREPRLINCLIGIAMRALTARDLALYALNACESPQEFSILWQWLEYLNTHEPSAPNPTNLAQALAMFQLEPVVNFLPEWHDAGLIETKVLEPNLLEAATRSNVAASRFQLVRMAAAARAHQCVTGRLPDSARDLAPLLPAGPPPDPFTSAPLRLVHSPVGVTCYSVGPDRADDASIITYDPTNGSSSRGDVILEVPTTRQYPFPSGGVRARSPEDLLAQFPAGLPPDPFARGKDTPLRITATAPVTIYSIGPDHDYNHTRGLIPPDLPYDPTNGTISRGDLFLQLPWR